MANISKISDAIDISSLPLTFQDAILITRKLGYRYLWIDSLCIVQDSSQDWQRESVKMSEIYSRAVLCIAASSAMDSHQGIFKSANSKFEQECLPGLERRPKLTQLVGHSAKLGKKSTLYARIFRGFYPGDDEDVLQQRAWTYQEAALSPRRLCYTSHGLTWSCVSIYGHDCDEMRPHGIHNFDPSSFYVRSVYEIDRQMLPTATEHKERDKFIDILSWWYRQVNEYACRQMTFPKDKFPAFSGLAAEFASRTGYQWKAGIWVQDFRRGLLWEPGLGVSWDFSPSWSWAAARTRHSGHGRPYDYGIGSWTYLDCIVVDLIEFVVETVGGNPFGQVISASITLRGLSQRLRDLWRVKTLHLNPKLSRHGGRILPSPEYIYVFTDVHQTQSQLLETGRDIILLQVARFNTWKAADGGYEGLNYMPTFALILERMNDSDAKYRRIGIAKMPEEGSAEQRWEMKTVTVV